jgi:hypothetical protein
MKASEPREKITFFPQIVGNQEDGINISSSDVQAQLGLKATAWAQLLGAQALQI